MPMEEERHGDDRVRGETRAERLTGGMAGYAIFMCDPDGEIESWPATATELYGYTYEALVGRPLRTLWADERTAPDEVADLLSEARHAPVEAEGWHVRADGEVFWATCAISPIENAAFHGYGVVCQDTTDRKQYERMLERQNDRLKEFTDILSHDLRNPLNVITGRLQLYEETGEPEHIEEIRRTTDRMERLIDDLLRVARQGDVVEDPEPVDLERVVAVAREGTMHDRATLEYVAVPRLMAEEDRLVELFENLLRNATEHGGAAVSVVVGPMEDGFFVADDGPGIPETERERVFDHGYTTNPDGSGFGLSVVRTVVGAHGWDVAVTEGEGGGARFEVTGIEFVE
ncbi:two-component system sensor histidine kinase NtrB [Haloglomus litoreum]|uniref:two-component system sensor histidine kinase NtrB n=1 Tax=Haloglomus litoreum TaxID=3034026 RepID=UPI0023E8F0F9|nr:PAS domain-containing sensor histidine kinase [Haloglomus sp. DT116]